MKILVIGAGAAGITAGHLLDAGEAMHPNGKTIAVHGACESAYAAVDAIGG